MEYCFLRGFFVVLVIQHCMFEGLSTSIQSSTVVTLQDGQALTLEPEKPPAEAVPMVAPPSLKKVQQAVQEASEQAEGRGAEEVLKELLERVVEAALGQVEGGGEVKADEAGEQETGEDVLGAEKGEHENDAEAEVLEEEAEGEDLGVNVGDTGAEEEQEVAEVVAFENAAEEEDGVIEGEVETAAGSVEEMTAVETGGTEDEEVEFIDESLSNEAGHKVTQTVAALEETGGDVRGEEAGMEDNKPEEKEAPEAHEEEETPAAVEVAEGGETEQGTVVESDVSLAVTDVEQIGDVWGREEALEKEIHVDEMEGEGIMLPSENYKMEATQTEAGEPIKQQQEEEVNIAKDTEGSEVEDEQDSLVVEGGAAQKVETEGTKVEGAEGGERHGGNEKKEDSVALENQGLGEQQAGEKEQIALETSHGSEKEDQEVLVISAPEPEDGADGSIEQSPENQAPTTSPSLGVVEAKENTLGEKSTHDNEIISPTDDLLPHDPVLTQPTLDNFVKDVLAEPPQAEGEEPGEANGLVEDGSKETSELGLEAWKTGAISAAAFLVLETAVIIIYVLKCRNKNSTLALQRACEEGCVEPEAATGGDCSDDTLPAGNGDTQQIAALDPSDAASTKAQIKEQHEEEQAIAMSDLPPASTEESANTGPGPDSSQDLRTSIL